MAVLIVCVTSLAAHDPSVAGAAEHDRAGAGAAERSGDGGAFSFTHLAVGPGESTVYQGPCGELGLLDTHLGRADVVLDELDRRGSRELAWAATSHYHNDHVGAHVDVLSAPGASARRVYDRGEEFPPDNAVYAGYRAFVTSPATSRRPVHVGATFSLCSGEDEVRFRVLSVSRVGVAAGGRSTRGENDRSICLLVTFRRFRHATCGDLNGFDTIHTVDLESVVAPHIGRVHTTLVNHHGMPQSSNPTYVGTLLPDVAVVATGLNPYGHPAPEVLERWRSAGANVLRTARGPGSNEHADGHVTITTTGWDAYRVTTSTGGEWTYALPAADAVDRQAPVLDAVTRLAGRDRVATAVAISRALWQRAHTVVVARADDYPDALAAGAVAAHHRAPLLLAGPGLVEEVERLGASEVIVAGGAGAVPDAVVAHLRAAATRPSVRRVAGPNRFATAAVLAAEAGWPGGRVRVASGEAFPDAVAAGTLLAAEAPPPLLLSWHRGAPPALDQALIWHRPRHADVLGGPAALAAEVEAAVAGRGARTRRVAGATRYETSLALLAEALAELPDQPRPLLAATGAAFPDALAAGAAAARLSAPLLLVPPSGPTPQQQAFLREHRHRFDTLVLVGGPAALAPQAEAALAAALR